MKPIISIVDKKFYEIPADMILASEGPYQRSIKQMVQSSPLRFYGLEQERVDLIQLRKDLIYWLDSLEDFFDGNYLTWHFPARLLKLRNSEQSLQELKTRYIGKESLKHSPRKNDINLQLSFKEMRSRVAKFVKELRDFWIVASIKYAESVAKSTDSLKQRRLRCCGLIDL
ncbi:uncharacterized protein LOC100679364 isoform X1 [Nasonia vitripennis]|uniref:Uncharacterized protein n=1 Tax=Nasonia vitripennis TaxID=7425 RepID=A0A7M7J4W2_NASVI|nr:uncharacterized protein LOC100679364 isoform X1 [Nasonia vitripennis]